MCGLDHPANYKGYSVLKKSKERKFAYLRPRRSMMQGTSVQETKQEQQESIEVRMFTPANASQAQTTREKIAHTQPTNSLKMNKVNSYSHNIDKLRQIIDKLANGWTRC